MDARTILKAGYSENTSKTVRYSSTFPIRTIVEIVQILEVRAGSKDYSLRYLSKRSVWSSRYLQEAQNQWARHSLNLVASWGVRSIKTSSSLAGSKLLNNFGNDAQQEPPNSPEAKTMAEIFSSERVLTIDWASSSKSLRWGSCSLFNSMNELTVGWAKKGANLISSRTSISVMPFLFLSRNLSFWIASWSLIPWSR